MRRRPCEHSIWNVVIVIYHGLSHNLKSLVHRWNVPVVFHSDFRLSRPTPFQQLPAMCWINRRDLGIVCVAGVVYKITLTCGCWHNWQAGCCMNERLIECERFVRNNALQSLLVWHVTEYCNCVPHWTDMTILAREKDARMRLLKEMWFINNHVNCISHAFCVTTAPPVFLNTFFFSFLSHVLFFVFICLSQNKR